jgi:OFA family oxalate/formate antiporter-like MFS transporter
MIVSSGYESAFWWFGIGQGVVVIVIALLLRAPEAGEVPTPAVAAVLQSRRDYGPAEVLKTAPFWAMYVMFVMVGTGGLMATAQLAPIAKDFKIDAIPVSILGLTLPALQFALSIDRVLNGFTRPFFGWVSDHIGRENTMFIAFLFEGIAFMRCCILPASRSCSCSCRDWCSLPGVRSIRSSRRPAPTSMAGSLPPRTTACCTQQSGLLPC